MHNRIQTQIPTVFQKGARWQACCRDQLLACSRVRARPCREAAEGWPQWWQTFLMNMWVLTNYRKLKIVRVRLSVHQAAWQSRVREFAQEELRPNADTFDVEKRFPTEQVANWTCSPQIVSLGRPAHPQFYTRLKWWERWVWWESRLGNRWN